jgi:hypothetical protein
MKLGIWRVYYHIITEKDGKEVSHTSPEMKMLAAEFPHQLLATLPNPPKPPAGCTARNVIVQVDQKHRDVLFNADRILD